MEFWIPYGETEVPIRVPDDNFYKILEPAGQTKPVDPVALLKDSLTKPVGEEPFLGGVKPGTTVGILLDPLVPPTLRNLALEQVRTRVEQAGASPKIFVRKRTSNVVLPPAGEEGVTVLEPNSGHFSELGQTRAGTKVAVEQEVLACETKVSVSMMTPHFATGFTGGPDLILPGASSIEAVSKNRSLLLQGIRSPLDYAENPLLLDAFEASQLLGPISSVCFIPDGLGGVDSVFAGEMEAVFKQARSRYLQVHSPELDRRADVVVVSAGNVLGMDLYHAVRVLSNAWNAVKKEGTIILVGECSRGVGDQNFLDYAQKFQERRDLLTELRHRFKLGAHVSLLLQEALSRNRIQLVSVLPDLYAKNMFRLKPSRTATGSVQQAIRVEGKDAKILIIPRGDLTLPVLSEHS